MMNLTNSTLNTTDGNQLEDGFNVPIIALVIGLPNLIIGSLLVAAILKLKPGKLKKTTRYFLLYQTVAHILLAFAGLTRGFLKQFSCEFTIIIPCIAFLICGSGLLIAVDSFLALYRPFTHKLILMPKRAKLAIIFTILLPLILLPAAVLTGQDGPGNDLCFTIHDSYFTPTQIIVFYGIVVAIIVISIILQGCAIILIYRMQRVSPAAPNIQNIATVSGTSMTSGSQQTRSPSVSRSVIDDKGPSYKNHSPLPTPEPVAGPSSSKTLVVVPLGPPRSLKKGGPTKGGVTIRVLSPSENDANIVNRSQQLQRAPTQHQNPVSGSSTRQKRLLRLLTAALVLTVVTWSPTLVAAIIVSTYDLVGIEKPAWFERTRWQIALLVFLDSFLYPIIVIAMSTELRACLRSLFFKLCRTSGE